MGSPFAADSGEKPVHHLSAAKDYFDSRECVRLRARSECKARACIR